MEWIFYESSNTSKTPWVLKVDGNNVENDVIVLQKVLVELGYLKMPTDTPFGTYAGLTETAVTDFQKIKGLYQDGKVGKDTWKKLSLPWDEENAQPDRNSWSYRYILQNNNFYTKNPEVTLITPTAKTELEAGESIKITAKGTNCHHLAVFINGEWKKTVFGDSNTNTINLEYDYVIPAVGKYNIQVKGRNIPGNSGVLVGSEIVEIEGTEKAFDLSFDNPDVWLTDQELITNLLKFKEYVRYNNGISFWELGFWQQDLIYEGIRFDRNTTTIDEFFNRLDGLRSLNDVPYNPGGTTYIDEGTVQAVIIEELKCQAAETWKKRIPIYLSALKTKILKLNTKYIEFISLTKDERKAIQYALKIYQTGEFDKDTSTALDVIHVVNNIPYIEGHTWAITPEMMNVIIDKSNKRAAYESINQTLTEISDFAEKFRLGEFFYSSVVLWAATRIPMGAAYDKTAEAIQKITSFEKTIVNEALEHGQFFTKTGDKIGDVIVGTEKTINISGSQSIAKDAIFTHNHPGNGLFSIDDLFNAGGYNMAEIRAVCPNGTTYSMTRSANGWIPKTYEELQNIWSVAKTEVKNDSLFQTLVQQGNTAALDDMFFQKVAKAIGGEYNVVR